MLSLSFVLYKQKKRPHPRIIFHRCGLFLCGSARRMSVQNLVFLATPSLNRCQAKRCNFNGYTSISIPQVSRNTIRSLAYTVISSSQAPYHSLRLRLQSSLIPLLLLFKSKRLFRFEDALVQRGPQALVELGIQGSHLNVL